jgi:phosphoribosylanthranilate isomerase
MSGADDARTDPSAATPRVRTKICGVTRVIDAGLAGRAGADFVGAILSAGFSRSVSTVLAARFSEASGRPLVGVTVDEELPDLVSLARRSGAQVLQLHGGEPPEFLEALAGEGEWELWKALRVRSAEEVLDALDRYGSVADGILLDGWHPEVQGGSGIRFPWDLVAPLRDRFPAGVRFVAAGGLQPENVAEAVRRLRPDVVDVSSGVEVSRGIKDAARVRAFIRNAQRDMSP